MEEKSAEIFGKMFFGGLAISLALLAVGVVIFVAANLFPLLIVGALFFLASRLG